jgi:hypothetical protein
MIRAGHLSLSLPVSLALALSSLALAPPAAATRPQVHRVAGYADLIDGDIDGTLVDGRGFVSLGPRVDEWVKDLPGPVLALARGGDGRVYVATAAPGRVWRVAKGSDPELIADLKKPLVTALLPLGRKRLVALSAPDGGAHVIDLSDRKAEPKLIEAKGVKMLLAGAVHQDAIYAVGGGDEGALLRWRLGDESFETLVTVKEKHLRSVAAQAGRRGPRVVVGGGDDGVVYSFEEGRLRALVDAEPGEVTAIALAKSGRVFAALVDSDGKLSKGATDRDEDDDDKDETKPRKVKSSEVLTIGPNGRVDVLWQSKKHGAYSLALDQGGKRLLLGTGASGRLYALDPAGKRRATALARANGHDEITVLVPDRTGVLLGTAHTGGVLALSTATHERGVYLSRVLDAESLARYGHAFVEASVPPGAKLLVSLRTGNTDEPDDTWSRFSEPQQADALLAGPAARYAQIRFELVGGKASPRLRAARLAYQNDNRPPEVARVEVLYPGWRVIGGERDPSDSRSVTFGDEAFKRFLELHGSQLPVMNERPTGKQKWSPGWRTVYAWVEDPDKDALRYRWYLGRVGADDEVARWTEVKDFSPEPFYSWEAARLADGRYRVRVQVDDVPTNGPARSLGDEGVSPTFRVAHAQPKFVSASAGRARGAFRVRLRVRAELPLAGVRCAVGGEQWVPVDPTDGIVDNSDESFDTTLQGPDAFNSVSCEAMDEGGNTARIDLPVVGR